jgi:hypothetical protein
MDVDAATAAPAAPAADAPSSSAAAAAPPAAASSSSSSAASVSYAPAKAVDTSGWAGARGSLQFKPHQNVATPSPGAGDRVFYESLYRENPASAMALIWCIEHGVFLPEEHNRLVPCYLEAKQAKRTGGGGGAGAGAGSMASPAKPGRPGGVGGVKAPAGRKSVGAGVVIDNTANADVGMSVGGSEGVGTMNF